MSEANERDQGVLNAITWAQREDSSMSAGVHFVAGYRDVIEREAREDERAKVIEEMRVAIRSSGSVDDRDCAMQLCDYVEALLRGAR